MRITAFLTLATLAGGEVAAQTARFDGWAGGGIGMGHRSAAVAGSVGTGSGSGPYIDAGLRYQFARISVRYLSTSFAADSGTEAIGKVTTGDAVLSLGPEVIGADIGYGQRGYTGSISTRTWTYLLAGGRADIPIGSSGFTAGIRLHVLLSVKEGGGGQSEGSGRMAETSLRYQPPGMPLYLLALYRMERFTVTGTSEFPEESTTLVLGGGLHFRR